MSPFGRGLILAVVATTAALVMASCGSASKDITQPPAVDPSLPGTWKGTLDGGESSNSYGRANITMVLRADSTFTSETDNPLYCSLNQTAWHVTGTQFTARGSDCTGTIVNFAAPVPTTVARLTGTWVAGSGRTGTFTMAKQP